MNQDELGHSHWFSILQQEPEVSFYVFFSSIILADVSLRG